MGLLTPYLNQSSFLGNGIDKDVRVNLPANFNYDVLAPFLTLVREGWLTNIIGDARLLSLKNWLYKAPGATDETDLFKLVEPFLVYAVWAAYIAESGVTATRTGLTVQSADQSDQLSDGQRNQLARNYTAAAERAAVRIAEYVAKRGECSSINGRATAIRIGKARGKNTERI